jgi:hypothetical protein
MTVEDLEIVDDEGMGEEGRFYACGDLAEVFWPGDFDHSNHAAEDKVRQVAIEAGAIELDDRSLHTPAGIVFLDSEMGMFECHAPTREPVVWILWVVRKIRAEHEKARKVLR